MLTELVMGIIIITEIKTNPEEVGAMSGSECLCGCECQKPCLAIRQLVQELRDECADCGRARRAGNEPEGVKPC